MRRFVAAIGGTYSTKPGQLTAGKGPDRKLGLGGGATATLVVIGESRHEERLDKLLTCAEKSIEKEIEVDSKEFKRDSRGKEYAAS